MERTTEGVEEGETLDDIAIEKAEAKVKEIEDAVYDLLILAQPIKRGRLERSGKTLSQQGRRFFGYTRINNVLARQIIGDVLEHPDRLLHVMTRQ